MWDLELPGATFGLRAGGGHFGAIWTLLETLLGIGRAGNRFVAFWTILEPLFGQRLAGTSLVSFGSSWSHCWVSGRQKQFWCLLDCPGINFGIKAGGNLFELSRMRWG